MAPGRHRMLSGNKHSSRLSAWLPSKALRWLTSFGTNFSVLISPLLSRISPTLSPSAVPPMALPRDAHPGWCPGPRVGASGGNGSRGRGGRKPRGPGQVGPLHWDRRVAAGCAPSAWEGTIQPSSWARGGTRGCGGHTGGRCLLWGIHPSRSSLVRSSLGLPYPTGRRRQLEHPAGGPLTWPPLLKPQPNKHNSGSRFGAAHPPAPGPLPTQTQARLEISSGRFSANRIRGPAPGEGDAEQPYLRLGDTGDMVGERCPSAFR